MSEEEHVQGTMDYVWCLYVSVRNGWEGWVDGWMSVCAHDCVPVSVLMQS